MRLEEYCNFQTKKCAAHFFGDECNMCDQLTIHEDLVRLRYKSLGNQCFSVILRLSW